MLAQLTPASRTNLAGRHEYFPFLFHTSIMLRVIGESIIGYKSKEGIIRHGMHPIHVMTIEARYTGLSRKGTISDIVCWPSLSASAILAITRLTLSKAISKPLLGV